jgi:predicted alpha/beta superfamily hydrolase
MVDVMPLPPVSIPNSEVRTLSSKSVGQEYRIVVALPRNYAESNDKYPVLYVSDAEMLFGWVTTLVRSAANLRVLFPGDSPLTLYARAPNLIVAGIGYPTTVVDQPKLWWSLRSRDLTPTQNPDDARAVGMEGTFGGNAEKFLRFMRDELMP